MAFRETRTLGKNYAKIIDITLFSLKVDSRTSEPKE
jgi:hypothetical protein